MFCCFGKKKSKKKSKKGTEESEKAKNLDSYKSSSSGEGRKSVEREKESSSELEGGDEDSELEFDEGKLGEDDDVLVGETHTDRSGRDFIIKILPILAKKGYGRLVVELDRWEPVTHAFLTTTGYRGPDRTTNDSQKIWVEDMQSYGVTFQRAFEIANGDPDFRAPLCAVVALITRKHKCPVTLAEVIMEAYANGYIVICGDDLSNLGPDKATKEAMVQRDGAFANSLIHEESKSVLLVGGNHLDGIKAILKERQHRYKSKDHL